MLFLFKIHNYTIKKAEINQPSGCNASETQRKENLNCFVNRIVCILFQRGQLQFDTNNHNLKNVALRLNFIWTFVALMF